MKLKTCLAPPAQPTFGSLSLLLIRIVAGVAFMMHGWGKIQHPFSWMGPEGYPGFFQFLGALSEFGGGLAWVLGLLTPLASLGIACTMVVATYKMAVEWEAPFVATEMGQPSYELSALYFCLSLVLLTVGPGRFSLDYLLFGRKA